MLTIGLRILLLTTLAHDAPYALLGKIVERRSPDRPGKSAQPRTVPVLYALRMILARGLLWAKIQRKRFQRWQAILPFEIVPC